VHRSWQAGLILLAVAAAGCGPGPAAIKREEFASLFVEKCRQKYQTRVVIKEAGDTVWIYLPYTPGRQGLAASMRKEDGLYVEYSIASLNPFKTKEPPELRFLVQKLLGEIRGAMLRTNPPYEYFVLVVADISDKFAAQEDWYYGYLPDIKTYRVGEDFIGEGYNRLAWYPHLLKTVPDEEGKPVSEAYKDVRGDHVQPNEVTLDEFIERQITWRVYKQFTIDYGKTAFDMAHQEKQDAVLRIVRTVFIAYNYTGVEKVSLRDSSFLDDEKAYNTWTRSELENLDRELLPLRKPAF